MEEGLPKKIKLLVTIVDRDHGEKVVKMYQSEGLYVNLMLMGRGTAHSDLLDILGLGDTDKYVILTPLKHERIEHVFSRLTNELHIQKAGHGVAFTLPMSSVGGPRTLKYFAGILAELLQTAEQKEGDSNERTQSV